MNYGASQTFTITPAANYHVADVLVDAASVGAVTTYTFTNVTAVHAIAASFVIDPAPVIASVDPSYGQPGTEVTITGSGFGSSRGSGREAAAASNVSFNGVNATEFKTWTDTRIVCIVPEGATRGPVLVATSAGSSNKTKKFTVSYPTWYLAEGTTSYGFETCITIQNPNASKVTANVTYMPTGKANKTEPVTLPANSQTTITNDHLVTVMGGNMDFSTRVECTDATRSIAVDRTMIWTGPGAASPEGHSSVGVTSPAKTWYLPEGSSKWGFETWLLIQNPGDKDASVTVTYMIEGAEAQAVAKTVPPNSRASFNMETDIGQKDASIKVESNVPVIPERAMYRNNNREGHDSIGTTTPAMDFYLAEGATGYNVGYITYVLVQNPQSTSNDVSLTYQTQAGEVAGPIFQMSPNSRKTIRVNDQLPVNTDVSTKVHGSAPIIAERAMYWNIRGAGTDTIGGFSD